MRELGAAHVAAGGSLGLLTLTVRHGPQNGLDELLTAELEAWKSIQQDDRWRELQRTRVRGPRGGVRWIEAGDELLVGHARTTESTQGFTTDPDGGSWHPHQHLVLFWRDGEDHSADVEWIENAWAERVEARLGLRPGAVGFDYRTIDASNVDYISKIADEITRADLKGGSRSIWALVEHAAEGDALAVRRWLEWCGAMKGRRCIHLSHGLRARYGLAPEISDEELAAVDVDGEHVAHLDARNLGSLMRCGWGEYPRMVDHLIGLDLAYARDNGPPDDAGNSQVQVESCREAWHADEHATHQLPLSF